MAINIHLPLAPFEPHAVHPAKHSPFTSWPIVYSSAAPCNPSVPVGVAPVELISDAPPIRSLFSGLPSDGMRHRFHHLLKEPRNQPTFEREEAAAHSRFSVANLHGTRMKCFIREFYFDS